MELPEGVVLLDSLGDLQSDNIHPILVCGSHCGGSSDLAAHIKNCGVNVAFLNNAGVGKNQAGIRGITHYDAANILACAVDNYSAEIGISQDTWESGIISHTGPKAEAAGIKAGDSVKEAIAKISHIAKALSFETKSKNDESAAENNVQEKSTAGDLKKQKQTPIAGTTVTVTDSITFLNKSNAGDIVVCGSHGGVSAGAYAQKYHVKAVFFNDAGIGKNNAGIKSLESLSEAGIPACTVDCMSAEIFNGQDVLDNGIITVCNQLAKAANINEKMTVKEAIQFLSE
ncbi:hypothetical protein [Draconibacterium sp.]|uniref:hypothetical protein n=1 Tax=Draconibacterium sp. TaxID=1965318 RepID=UPI00356671A5